MIFFILARTYKENILILEITLYIIFYVDVQFILNSVPKKYLVLLHHLLPLSSLSKSSITDARIRASINDRKLFPSPVSLKRTIIEVGGRALAGGDENSAASAPNSASVERITRGGREARLVYQIRSVCAASKTGPLIY